MAERVVGFRDRLERVAEKRDYLLRWSDYEVGDWHKGMLTVYRPDMSVMKSVSITRPVDRWDEGEVRELLAELVMDPYPAADPVVWERYG